MIRFFMTWAVYLFGMISVLCCIYLQLGKNFSPYFFSENHGLENTKFDICTIGAGLSGAVIAERFANVFNSKVLVLEKRSHIGGNTYDYVDKDTNILMSKYGAHLFHTNIESVWEYINSIPNAPAWVRWDHQVLGLIDEKLVPIPVNIITVNSLFGMNLQNEHEMKEWLNSTQIACPTAGCKNAEEMALSRVGSVLFSKIFKHYTMKQWAKQASDLDASVTSRIPVRHNFDNRYFDDKYQVLPSKGYTEWVRSLLSHPSITVRLNEDYFSRKPLWDSVCDKIFFTGPIDRFFESSGLPKLEYRGIDFHVKKHFNVGYMQSASVINYPDPSHSITRIVEYKHLLHQKSEHSVTVAETSKNMGPNDDPYYPVPNSRNSQLFARYQNLSQTLERHGKVFFLGRLANYKYFNMDQTIDNALKTFQKFVLPS